MLKNYLLVALRNVRRHKVYTIINVAGLGLGLACCLLIVLFVRDELRYDRHHRHADRIYRITTVRHAEGGTKPEAATPPPLGPALASSFPEVQAAVRFFKLSSDPLLVRHGDRQFYEPNVLVADASVFDVFTLPLARGDAATALAEPLGIVLSAETARRYFGDEDPLGQTLTVQNDLDLTVTGVLVDLPEQSHLDIDLLGSFAMLSQFIPEERMSRWSWEEFFTYVLLADDAGPAALAARLPAFVEQYAAAEANADGFRYELVLQPLTDIYLRPTGAAFEIARTGSITYVYAFMGIGVLVLLIACFNFMNLATARSLVRAKEVGMRKVIGAQRGQLARQFLGEAVLMAFAALTVAVVLVQIVLPAFRAFTGKILTINFAGELPLVAGFLAGTVVVGLLAGGYPALVLSGLPPLRVLRGVDRTVQGAWLRKSLVVFQFAISILLLVAAVVVYRQLDYLRTTPLGFEKEQVVVVPLRGALQEHVEAVKEELLRLPTVVSAAAAYGVPSGRFAVDGIRLPGREEQLTTTMFLVEPGYTETYGMEIVAGRTLSPDHPADADRAFVLNETAARALGWTPEEAIGQVVLWDVWNTPDSVKEGAVIGVVADFHMRSLHHAVEPFVMHVHRPAFSTLSLRVRPDDLAATLTAVEATWERWAPDWPFEYTFLDATLDAQYRSEERLSRLAAGFSGLAVVIACLGLFGLAAHTAERRAKEIGVRKVLGASVASLVGLLSRDVLCLVAAGFVLGAPLAYLAMERWLADFPYHVELAWWLFAAAGGAALAVALATVSVQALRAATADPVRTLRSE